MAKSALPLLLGAAAAFLILSKKNGGGGTAQTNIHIVEEGDKLESLLTEALEFPGGERLVIVMSSFEAYGPAKVSEALLPYAQANPKAFFVVIAGPGLDAAASWFGDDASSAPTNKFGVFIADSVADASNMKTGVTAENAAATLDELIKWSVETALTAESASPGTNGTLGLGVRLQATTMSTNGASRGLASGPTTGTNGDGFGVTSTPAGFDAEVVDAAVKDGLALMFSS